MSLPRPVLPINLEETKTIARILDADGDGAPFVKRSGGVRKMSLPTRPTVAIDLGGTKPLVVGLDADGAARLVARRACSAA